MKLFSSMLTLAALAAASMLGSTEAGVLTGPCTITADMSTLEGTCPSGGFENCLSSVDLSSDSSGSATMAVYTDCLQPGVNSLITQDNGNAAVASKLIKSNYRVAVGGSYSADTISTITDSSGNVLCRAKATVTSGTCLYSERTSPPSAAHLSAASVVAVAAAGALALVSMVL